MFDCTQLNRNQIEQAENDGLEGEKPFKFMYEADSTDLRLNYWPTDCSCIQARNERDCGSSIKRSSRSFIQQAIKSRSSVARVVFS